MDDDVLPWVSLLWIVVVKDAGVGYRVDAWVVESDELSLILIFTSALFSNFLDIDPIPDSRDIPSVIIDSPLYKFSASRTANHDPIKKINSPITLEAGVA